MTKETSKVEKEINKRLEQFRKELECNPVFEQEQLSDAAKESLIESMGVIFRHTQRSNKKYIPFEYRKEES